MRILFFVISLAIMFGCRNGGGDSSVQQKINDMVWYGIKNQSCENADSLCVEKFDVVIGDCKNEFSSDWNDYISSDYSDDGKYEKYLDDVGACIVEHESLSQYFPQE